MFQKLIDLFVKNYDSITNRTVVTVLFITSFFIRFPFFFRDYIDRDESTFILMGQSWVDGYLPYTQLWDLKPPVIFLFFATIIYSFGKSFIAIRFFGAVIVALTAFFTYKIGETTHSKKIGLWAAIACVLLLSLFGSLQGVMSEHICMLFFLPALYLVIKYIRPWAFLCAGLLLGLSLMSKLNIAYVILVLCLNLLYSFFNTNQFWKGLTNILLLGLGIISITLSTFLPYYFQDLTDVWWNSVIMAPIEYSASHQNPIYKTAPFCIIILTFLVLIWKQKLLNFSNRGVSILMATVFGEILMFTMGGKVNGHYLIQFYPVFIVLFFMVIAQLEIVRNKSNFLLKYLPFLLFLIPIESYIEYANILKSKWEQGTFYNGEGIRAPNYILQNNLETKNILFLEYHIGYWVLDETPLTVAATHPSNILRESLFPYFNNPRKTGLEEIRYIMETIKPQTVVIRKNKKVFDKKYKEANLYINHYLESRYKLTATVGNAKIHQRLE
ncbi:glycosyltransferase family 39 protein [Zobellia sp. 1_MG-2023]|uniref:ArnT family glycosyltransferase n=1 Tax=Zobellia sp. 1_MG-2023 TaxID=3062626 RepID=UPI0026E16291|nr:glycosyltransferase family 39 protein [Zobellia sp. 1_MG-2023]MDO6817843.1 glycosyltransferase family 39 protein [Zobellia sp. 1_MG-2023]